MNRATYQLARNAALLFGGFLVRIAMRDIAWMTWQAAKSRMHQRANWRRRQLGFSYHDDAIVAGPSGTRRIMDDDHIEEWWNFEGEYEGPIW